MKFPYGALLQLLTLFMVTAGRAAAQVIVNETPTTSLSALHDIVEPATVAWWPPAPGWYFIGLLVVVLLTGWLVAWRRRVIANRYRGAALAELDLIKAGAKSSNQLSAIVKRVALAAWPRAEVASRTGNAWWQFVGSTGVDEAFPERYGVTLDRLAYGPPNSKPPAEEEVVAAVTGVEGWVRGHRVPGKD